MFDRKGWMKRYEDEHREQRNACKRRYTRKLKQEVLAHYSNTVLPSCSRCGVTDTDVLCVDHINGGGKRQLAKLGIMSGTGFYQWLRTNHFPEGYQVLCANCNLKKSIKEKC